MNTSLDPRVVFTVALQTAANAIILARNHPRGSLEPSSADPFLINRLKDIGDILDIPLLDHPIQTREGNVSFKELGLPQHYEAQGKLSDVSVKPMLNSNIVNDGDECGCIL